MKKYFYFLLSLFIFTQNAAAKNDCDKHIENYFNKNYVYKGGASAAAELAVQRRCLHARNPIYSDAYEFEQKQKYFLSIDDSFLVRKNLIDYQETAEVFAENEDIEKSSKYTDKFNEILVKHYDKILAAKILKEQVESGLISKAHQKELFEKLDEYLFKIGKCNPGICESWGLISTVAGAFPKCAEDSCQKNITYQNLYFDLARSTNNSKKATETIKKLLAKDFGTSKSNGEVKAPLMMALYYTDLDVFSAQAKNFLDKAQKTIKYDYQDAILLPLITQLMLTTGQAKDLLPYTKTKYKNVAGLEATLALLSINLGDSVRQNLRADLEIYYELTSACEEYRYEEYQGEKILRAGTPATLTQNTELDLFLRQRIQSAYWTDNVGNIMNNVATSHWCTPPLNKKEEIYPVFASAQLAKKFIKEGFIDDVLLLPLFAFNKIKAVVQGMRQAPKTLKISHYNDRAALEVAKAKQELENNIISLYEHAEELPIAVGDGLVHSPYIGDNETHLRIYNLSKSNKFARRSRMNRNILYGGKKGPRNPSYPEEFAQMTGYQMPGFSKTLEKAFARETGPVLQRVGIDKAYQLRKALSIKSWKELDNLMWDPVLGDILARANPRDTEIIIDKLKNLYYRYYGLIQQNNTKGHFIFAYIKKYDDIGFNIANIKVTEEITEKNLYLQNMFGYSLRSRRSFLSESYHFSPKTSKGTVEAYTSLLGCSSSSPCFAVFSEKETILYLYSNDQSKLIRVTSHEYNMSEAYLTPHFHYYELNYEYPVNHMILVDMNDPYNTTINKIFAGNGNKNFRTINQQLKELLMPREEIVNSTNIRVSFE